MKTTVVMFLMFLISASFAVARFIVPVEGAIAHDDIFKDAAHLFVGFAFGWAFYTPEKFKLWGLGGVNWMIPVALTVVEVVAFVARGKTDVVPVVQVSAAKALSNGCRCGDACDCTPLDDICGCRAGPPIVFQSQIEK